MTDWHDDDLPVLSDFPTTVAEVGMVCEECGVIVGLGIDVWTEIDDDGDKVLRLDAGTMDLEAHLMTHG